jgi:hypothetical protein
MNSPNYFKDKLKTKQGQNEDKDKNTAAKQKN